MYKALALLVAAASPVLIAATQREASTEAYLALIVRYVWGEHDAVTREVAAWPLEKLQVALRDLPLVLPVVSRRHDIPGATLVATATVLHVDIARRANTDEAVDRNLALGQRLSDLLPLEDDGGPVTRFRGRWHHAAGTVLCGSSRPVDARRHLEIARKLRPDDSGILLGLGSVGEVEAWIERPERAQEHLAQAAALFEAALAMRPDLDEARIRLARIQFLLGRVEVAARTIGPALERAEGPYFHYLARLIGGGISDAQGRFDEAIARYREAHASCRRCPAAAVGLSHALLATGNRTAARELVAAVVKDDEWPPPGDPWWIYQQGQWREIDAILDTLRQEIPK